MENEKILFEHMDLLRSEVVIEEILNVALPTYHLQYLKNNNRIPEEATISSVLRHEDQLLEKLKEAFTIVENEIPELKGVYKIFPGEKLSQKLIFNFLLQVNKLNMSNEEWSAFIDQLLYMTYENGGRHVGEMFSPKSVNELGIKILNPVSGSFFDGTAGIGGTMIEAGQYGKRYGENIKLYGQEMNYNNWALAKLNLMLHGIENVDLQLGDTLLKPAFIEGKNIKKFDRIMMDIPFSMNITEYEELVNDAYNRFIYGNPPKTKADMAFVMHGTSSLTETGKAVFVVPNGTLFRQGIEAKIRHNMLAADVIEAVIALPEKLFETTSIQTNLLVLNKNKSSERQGKVLFINAEDEYEELNRRKRLLSNDNINKIVHAYETGKENKGFSKFIESEKIEDADLLCKRYLKEREIVVDTFGKVKVSEDKFNKENKNVPLPDLVESIYRGLNVSSKSVEEGHGEYKIIKLSDVQDGEINIDELTPVTLKRNSKVEMYLVQKGDVIISNRGTNIKIAVVPPIEEKILLSHNFLGIRCIRQKLDPYFLKLYLESPVGQYMLTSKQVGTHILTINPKDLKDIKVPLPSIDEQMEIVEGFYDIKFKIQEKLQQLEREKRELQLQLYEYMGIRDSFEIIE